MKPVTSIVRCLWVIPRVRQKVLSPSVTKEELAYIAGFLDGDGCIMLQLIYRHDYVFGYQIRASIVFYQKTKYTSFLESLKEKLKYGYIRQRNDGICEYTIVGVEPVEKVLKLISPYLKLKKPQADLAMKVLAKMPGRGRKLTKELIVSLAQEVDKFAGLNYSKKRTNTSISLINFLKSHHLLDPVETDPQSR